jgi:hypothetical protein
MASLLHTRGEQQPELARARQRCRRKFLRFFPRGFADPKYQAWERGYKWEAHEAWEKELGRTGLQALLAEGAFEAIARRAVRIESRTNLLFSFEKMALRDAVREPAGAQLFAQGLNEALYGRASQQQRFLSFGQVLDGLPRKQTRVHTWPLHTVFGFIARPRDEIFLKPNVTRAAAEAWGFDFQYASRPNWNTYASLLEFARSVSTELADMKPRDLIDIQSFIWVLGSSEYG